jgi:hypothetical protein
VVHPASTAAEEHYHRFAKDVYRFTLTRGGAEEFESGQALDEAANVGNGRGNLLFPGAVRVYAPRQPHNVAIDPRRTDCWHHLSHNGAGNVDRIFGDPAKAQGTSSVFHMYCGCELQVT